MEPDSNEASGDARQRLLAEVSRILRQAILADPEASRLLAAQIAVALKPNLEAAVAGLNLPRGATPPPVPTPPSPLPPTEPEGDKPEGKPFRLPALSKRAILSMILVPLGIGLLVALVLGGPPLLKMMRGTPQVTASTGTVATTPPETLNTEDQRMRNAWRRSVSTLIDDAPPFFTANRPLICGQNKITLDCQSFDTALVSWATLRDDELPRLEGLRKRLGNILKCPEPGTEYKPDSATAIGRAIEDCLKAKG